MDQGRWSVRHVKLEFFRQFTSPMHRDRDCSDWNVAIGLDSVMCSYFRYCLSILLKILPEADLGICSTTFTPPSSLLYGTTCSFTHS